MKPQLESKHKHNLDVCLKNVSRIIENPDAFTSAEKLVALESICNQRSLLVFVDTFEEPTLQEAQEHNHAGSIGVHDWTDRELDVQDLDFSAMKIGKSR